MAWVAGRGSHEKGNPDQSEPQYELLADLSTSSIPWHHSLRRRSGESFTVRCDGVTELGINGIQKQAAAASRAWQPSFPGQQ